VRTRRYVITLLGGVGAFPFIAHAQQSDRMRRIGALMAVAENDADAKVRAEAFQRRLHQLGWIEGRNVSIEYRWAAADQERMAVYAAELVASARPDTS
jgi:putative tryptophan/tyrosine transport system substrate-binding protein